MATNINWYPINRKALPGVLIGMEPLPLSSDSLLDVIKEADVALGIPKEIDESIKMLDFPNKIMVVDQSKASSLFSWLNTYTKESFPLSQFVRVLSYDDWAMVENEKGDANKNSRNPWGCIILGEMLGQSESNSELAQLPLSRAMACFSFAIARSSLAYGSHSHSINITAQRLRMLESDHRFLKRFIKVDDLTRVWTLTTSTSCKDAPPKEAVELVSNALNFSLQKDLLGESYKPLDVLFSFKDLLSDSAEVRVRAFDQLVDMTINIQDHRGDPQITAATIAAGVFLVGRGTSHIGLLSSVATKYPTCYIWFALLAGISGPKYWHPDWSKAVRGVEKQIKQTTQITDPINSDLCWVEYYWLNKTYDSIAVFHNLPKLTPKLLSVEIVPGSPCQFRLDEEAGSNVVSKEQISQVKSRAVTNMLPVFTRMEELAKIGKMLIQSNTSISEEDLELLINNMSVNKSKTNRKKSK